MSWKKGDGQRSGSRLHFRIGSGACTGVAQIVHGILAWSKPVPGEGMHSCHASREVVHPESPQGVGVAAHGREHLDILSAEDTIHLHREIKNPDRTIL